MHLSRDFTTHQRVRARAPASHRSSCIIRSRDMLTRSTWGFGDERSTIAGQTEPFDVPE
jgi:hypothetical protein